MDLSKIKKKKKRSFCERGCPKSNTTHISEVFRRYNNFLKRCPYNTHLYEFSKKYLWVQKHSKASFSNKES